jgi:hypothetical protein
MFYTKSQLKGISLGNIQMKLSKTLNMIISLQWGQCYGQTPIAENANSDLRYKLSTIQKATKKTTENIYLTTFKIILSAVLVH